MNSTADRPYRHTVLPRLEAAQIMLARLPDR